MTDDELNLLTTLRRDLHRTPELAFEEERTAEKVCRVLDEAGIAYERGLGRTGVVATLRAGSGDKAIALRADFDALAIAETTNLEYRSQNPGVMHACGHDGHTTMLAGAARALAKSKSFDGTVHFIFQPAEERGVGAAAMIDDGLFDRFAADAVYSMHNMPWLPAGQFATRAGPIMAAEDNFEIRISGRGGHAAMPHHTKDALVTAAAVVTELQTIVSRAVDPLEGAVVSCTQLETDGAPNVIASHTVIRGDARSFCPAVSELIEQRMKAIVAGLCAAHGAEFTLDYTRVFAPTINTPAETDRAAAAARAVAGADNVDADCAPMMASEDFAAMLREKPGNYIFIGNAAPDGKGSTMLHNPAYDFNDDIIPLGVAYWVALVERELSAG